MEEDKNNPNLIIKNISLKDPTGKTVTQPLVVATERCHDFEELRIKSILENYKKLYLKNKKEE